MRWFLACGLALGLAACSSGPRRTVDSLISSIEARDADGALGKMVSGAQLDELISCATPTSAAWLTSTSRKTKLDALRPIYATADRGKHVKLGSLFEDYDRPAQWHSYAVGDLVNGDCHAKAPFEIEQHRIVVVTWEDGRQPVESTKPIELWKIDGKYFAYDDPMDTEGWR